MCDPEAQAQTTSPLSSTHTMTHTSLVLHTGPAVGFDQPFEMLHACHERVQRSLDLLNRLGEHLQRHGADAQAAAAARDVMRYFDLAGPQHHLDEEHHVLPRLCELGQGELAARLHTEHEHMAAAWVEVRVDLCRVAQREVVAPEMLAEWRARWAHHADLYGQHMRDEETLAYPRVQAALSLGEEQSMGREMAARRHAHGP
jgi:hemerythrin-like domain-containing protein